MINQKIRNSIAIVLELTFGIENSYKFKNNDKIIYLFKTSIRKRNIVINKLLNKYLIKNELIEIYKIISILKFEFN